MADREHEKPCPKCGAAFQLVRFINPREISLHGGKLSVTCERCKYHRYMNPMDHKEKPHAVKPMTDAERVRGIV